MKKGALDFHVNVFWIDINISVTKVANSSRTKAHKRLQSLKGELI